MDPYLSHAKNTTFEHTFLGVKLWQVNVQIEAILAAIDFWFWFKDQSLSSKKDMTALYITAG